MIFYEILKKINIASLDYLMKVFGIKEKYSLYFKFCNVLDIPKIVFYLYSAMISLIT
jgi:hypothetical protein